MKKSISTWSFYGEWNLEQKLTLAREAGFSGFEIDLSDDGPVNFSTSPTELAVIRAAADKAGLTLSGLASTLYWGANPASADPAIRGRADTILKRQIECASVLGIDAILVIPGSVGVDFIPGSEVIPYEVVWDRAMEFLRAALPLAEKHKITLCVENVWNKFLLSPLEMRTFIDAYDSEFIGVYFDAGNVLATGYPEQWIKILGPRIRRIHFKDYRRNVGTVDGFCDLLSGDVDWPAVRRALDEAGYDGWITAEMIPPVPFYKYAPEVLIHNTSRAMDAIFAL